MIYLDNAATSFPKPEAVYAAAEKAVRELGGNPSRSGHILSGKSGEAIFSCREALAKMFGARAENVVFTLNATHALNTAIKGIARHGDHFLISNIEHNAVLRPIASLCERIGCSYDTIDVIEFQCDGTREIPSVSGTFTNKTIVPADYVRPEE